MSPLSFLPGRSGPCAAALLITTSLLLGGCKAGDSAAKPADSQKAADAVPVETAKAARRAVAASYTALRHWNHVPKRRWWPRPPAWRWR